MMQNSAKNKNKLDVLLVDASVSGHHIYYNAVLLNGLNSKLNAGILSSRNSYYKKYRSFGFPWLNANKIIKNINYFFFVIYSFYLAKRFKAKIIHFLSGDDYL